MSKLDNLQDLEAKLNQLSRKKDYVFINNFKMFLLYHFKFLLFFILILLWQILNLFKIEFSKSFLDVLFLIILGSELNERIINSIWFIIIILMIIIILIISYIFNYPNEFFSLLLILLIAFKIQDYHTKNKIINTNSEK